MPEKKILGFMDERIILIFYKPKLIQMSDYL